MRILRGHAVVLGVHEPLNHACSFGRCASSHPRVLRSVPRVSCLAIRPLGTGLEDIGIAGRLDDAVVRSRRS